MEKRKYTTCLEAAVSKHKSELFYSNNTKWFLLFFTLYDCFLYKLLEREECVEYNEKNFCLQGNGERKEILLKTYKSLLCEFARLEGWSIEEYRIPQEELILQEQKDSETVFSLKNAIIREINHYSYDEAVCYAFHDEKLDFLLSEKSPLTVYEKKELLEQLTWYVNNIYIGREWIECCAGRVYGILVSENKDIVSKVSPMLVIYCEEFKQIMERYQSEYA